MGLNTLDGKHLAAIAEKGHDPLLIVALIYFKYSSASMYDDLIQEATVEAEEYLKQMSQQLSNEGVGEIQSYVRQGEAAGTILDLADESPSTLITMCTHGRSGVGRLVLGSVTDRVVRHSNRPVLVIRAGD